MTHPHLTHPHRTAPRRARLTLALLALMLLAPLWAVAAPVHALARHGAPKYGPDFTHFAYVNPDAPKGGHLRLMAPGTFDTLNPFVMKGEKAAGLEEPFGVRLVYEPLMAGSYDEPFTMYCVLCEGVELSEDRRSVTFTLREGARWHDGRPVTAQDVTFSFETLMKRGSPFFKAYWGDVAGVRADGARRVTFTLDDPDNAELPLIIGQLPVLPAHAYDPDAVMEKPLGSGPYRVAEVRPGRSVVYEKAPDWWGAALPVNRGRYNFERITYDYYRDDHAALEAFLAGAYDLRLENRAQAWAHGYDAPAVADGRIVKAEIPHRRPQGLPGFVFNTRRPVFEDAATRAALAQAFDFDRANRTLGQGVYARADSVFTNSDLADPDAPPPADGDARAAARALQAAGWAPGPDGVRVRSGRRLAFEILLGDPAAERWALAYARDLKRAGADARVRIVDAAMFQDRLNRFEYDMVLAAFPQSDSPGNEQRDFWASYKADVPGARNLAGVRDPAVDAAIEAVIAAASRADLVAACRALDRLIRAGHYVVPGWHLPHWRIAYWPGRIARPETLSPLTPAVADTWWAAPQP